MHLPYQEWSRYKYNPIMVKKGNNNITNLQKNTPQGPYGPPIASQLRRWWHRPPGCTAPRHPIFYDSKNGFKAYRPSEEDKEYIELYNNWAGDDHQVQYLNVQWDVENRKFLVEWLSLCMGHLAFFDLPPSAGDFTHVALDDPAEWGCKMRASAGWCHGCICSPPQRPMANKN